MDNTTYTNYVTRYFNAIFKNGGKIFSPYSTYINANNYGEYLFDNFDKVNANVKRRSGVDLMNATDTLGNCYCVKNALRIISEGIMIIPDFLPIINEKLHELKANNPDIVIGNGRAAGNFEACANFINGKLIKFWHDMNDKITQYGKTYSNSDDKKYIDNCEDIDWIVNDTEFFNLTIVNNFFVIMSLINSGFAKNELAEDYVMKIEDETFGKKLTEYSTKIVEHYIGNNVFMQKIQDYVNRFEDAVFMREKGMKPIEKTITVNYINAGNDSRICDWEKRGRSGQDNLDNTTNAYLLVEYKLKDAIGGVRKKRALQNAANFFKMNKMKSNENEFYSENGVFESWEFANCLNSNFAYRPHFVFANKSRSDKYENDFYDGCEYMILQISMKWATIGQKPSSISNFLPDMGGEMNLNFSF